MRILYTIDSLQLGGKERQLLELLKGINLINNIEFRVLLYLNYVNYDISSFHNSNFIIHNENNRSKKAWFYRFNKTVHDFKPDIIHSWENLSLIFSYILKPKYNYKIIDGSIRYSAKFRLFSKQSIISKLSFIIADKIVANSNKGLKVCGISNWNKATVIYNGIDISRFEDSNQQRFDRKYDLICLANFLPSKDHITLINTILKMNFEGNNVNLLLIGDGPELQSIKNMIPESMREKFVFIGHNNKVEDYIYQAKIGVLLSNSKQSAEGISNSIMEYMCAGLPVIATNTGGTPELVNNNNNGFLINPFDIKSLEESILSLLNDSKIYHKFSIKSKLIIEEKFSNNIMVNNYILLYKELLESRN